MVPEQVRRPRGPGAPPRDGSGGCSPTAAGSPAAAARRARRRPGTGRLRRCGPAPATRRARPRPPARRRRAPRLGRGVGQARPRRQQVGALEEQPLAVDRADPVVERDLAQAGAARAVVAELAVDEQVDADVGQRLVAEPARPPQAGLVDVERPLDLVDAGGEGVLGLGHGHAVGGRAHPHRAGDVGVDARRRARTWARFSSASRHSTRSRSSFAGPVSYTSTGRPQPAGVPVAVDGLGVLQQPGDVAAAADALLGRARHLDGQHVVVAEPGQRRDVEALREEVALRVAEVGAVEPDVGLVEDPVERHPAAPARARGRAARTGSGRGSDRRSWPASGGCASARGRRRRASRGRRGRGRCRRAGGRRRRRRPSRVPAAPRAARLMVAPLAAECVGGPGVGPAASASRPLGSSHERPSRHHRAAARVRVGVPFGQGRDPVATPSPASPPVSRCSRGSSATRTPCCRSSRTPSSPATT